MLPAGAGRQRSSVGKSGKHKATTSRSRAAAKALDAFGIAAAEDDDRTGKGGKRTRISNRMRDLEPERPVRKQHQRDEEEEGDGDGEGGDDEGGSGRRRKRQKVDAEEGDAGSLDDFGSDSDGNEWHVGVQDEDEDSEIDSDEAFGESDEERFEGFAFGGSSSNKAKKKGGKAPKVFLGRDPCVGCVGAGVLTNDATGRP